MDTDCRYLDQEMNIVMKIAAWRFTNSLIKG